MPDIACIRVKTSHLPKPEAPARLFEEGQYLLRVYEPGYQEIEAIELELTWLAAMRRDANLPVPEPIATLDGRWLLSINVPGVAGTRNFSLLRWITGRSVENRFRPHHFRAQGRLKAHLQYLDPTLITEHPARLASLAKLAENWAYIILQDYPVYYWDERN